MAIRVAAFASWLVLIWLMREQFGTLAGLGIVTAFLLGVVASASRSSISNAEPLAQIAEQIQLKIRKLEEVNSTLENVLSRLHRVLSKEEAQILEDIRLTLADKLTDETKARIRELALSGKKIEAIKELRTAAGLGLIEAKEIVERIGLQSGGF